MATVKKGLLTVSGEWWKHLRSTKRAFWKGERRAAKKFARQEASDTHPDSQSVKKRHP
jgi:hypothetical protein